MLWEDALAVMKQRLEVFVTFFINNYSLQHKGVWAASQ